ncbi:MAG: bifunctional oligoribonuclease/PAP phosphatase NrnA [Eubacterium sp.]|nr:bifunctional oligoribonuclease/PAP phosphatase NrnA [Oscillospiraceae bacterium]MDY4608393.1 bifunctional oligoribonuclease/PAP phosphatase NrnA [Eubacterium sp.]
MKINVEKCAQILREKDNILILTHAHPDGDTLGCGFALCRALLELGKKARVICADEIQKKYAYLMQDLDMPSFDEDYVVAVDVATENLLGSLQDVYGGKIDMCIDHHGSNTDYAKYLLLNADAAAACEIIFKVIKALGVDIDKNIANCLYTGLTTDTGCFRYSSATSNTYRAAAELIDLGADNGKINRIMFETKTKTYAALERMAIEGMQFFCNERICVITVTQDMYKKTGSNEQETEAIAPLTRQTEGVEIGLTIREKPDGTCKCSIRTYESVDASALAACFGGGGHKQASACKFDCGVEEAKQMLVKKGEEMLSR